MRSNPVRCDLENSGLELDIRPLQAEYLALAEAQRECNRRHQQAGRFVTDRKAPRSRCRPGLGAGPDRRPGPRPKRRAAHDAGKGFRLIDIHRVLSNPTSSESSSQKRQQAAPPARTCGNRGASYPEGRHAGLAVGPNSDPRSAHQTRPSRPPG
jgi:hypothetical protein